MRKDGKPYTTKENKHRFFFPQEFMSVYEAMKKKQKHTAKFLINTGARINEARNVKVEDIDFTNKRMTLKVTKAKARKGESVGRVRIIPISYQFSKYLRTYTLENGLLREDNFNLLSTPGFNMALKAACMKAEIKDWRNFSAHTLRKTLEVWLMALGIDSLKLTAHLGHDIRTAAHHYVSPDVFSAQERREMRMIIGDLYDA